MTDNPRRSSARPAPPAGAHRFDNSGEKARSLYRQLSALYDWNTIRYIERRGIAAGWSCLEVGAGGGSIASWLCARVGPLGQVCATDIDTSFLNELSASNLQVLRHDLRTESLPTSVFDLAHVRLVLLNLPDRDAILGRIIRALKPGGWIVVEEFDALSLLPDPEVSPGEVDLKLRRAFQASLTARGADLRYGRLLPQKLRDRGLAEVGAEVNGALWSPRTAGFEHMRLSFEHMRASIVSSGLMSHQEIEADMRRIDQEAHGMLSPMMWTAWGRA